MSRENKDAYCNKLIKAIERCVEVYNKYSKNPINIKEKPLKGHTVIAKKHLNEVRIAVMDSLSAEDKLRNLVYIFSCNADTKYIFSRFGNKHVWDAVMRYILFGECETEEIQINYYETVEKENKL